MPLLFLSSLINWIFGLLVGRSDRKKPFLVIGLSLNMGILFFFKYTDFILRSLNNLFLFLGRNIFIKPMGLILPVGISFFTFQGMSYLIDVYRGDTRCKNDFSHILLFISFFPQLVAGPILRSHDFLPQLLREPDPSAMDIGFSLRKISTGLFKKIVIANYLSVLFVDPLFLDPSKYVSFDLLLGAYAYGIQIFCDFSAYSDIAIGIANLLGFHFMENFDKPYSAPSLKEFWRKWHISLSSWLRDYLYIPLGGSRHGKKRTCINLFLTMLLGGIWHGAGWNFIIWGMIHGLWLILERLVKGKERRRSPMGRALGILLTFHVVTAAWIFFRAPHLSGALSYYHHLISFSPNGPSTMVTPFIILLLALGFLGQFTPSSWEKKVERKLNGMGVPSLIILSLAFFILLQILAPQGMSPFIYFQF